MKLLKVPMLPGYQQSTGLAGPLKAAAISRVAKAGVPNTVSIEHTTSAGPRP